MSTVIVTDLEQAKTIAQVAQNQLALNALNCVYFLNSATNNLKIAVTKTTFGIKAEFVVTAEARNGALCFSVTANKVLGMPLFRSTWLTQLIYQALGKIVSKTELIKIFKQDSEIRVYVSKVYFNSLKLKSYDDQSVEVSMEVN